MSTIKSKSYLLIAILLVTVFALTGCLKSSNVGTEAPTSDVKISATIKKDAKFDSANLDVNATDFENAGFAFGDACDVEFSNGYTMTNIPYFNGYYVKTGEPVIVAYPQNDYVTIAINNGDFWTPQGLSDGDTVTITLSEKGKYTAIQDSVSQTYSIDRQDYSTDEQFANFRSLKGGNLKENFLFRGASPVDNSRGRASIANSCVEKAQIQTIIDLADTDSELGSFFSSSDFNSAYVKGLYDSGKMATLGLGANYDSQEYKASLARGLRLLLSNGGPAYIHCTEGKDRTGFVCMLLEAFAGATFDEMSQDYMRTYANYFGITKDADAEKYRSIRSLYFDTFCAYLSGEEDATMLKAISYTDAAQNYLASCGLTTDELTQLHSLIEK